MLDWWVFRLAASLISGTQAKLRRYRCFLNGITFQNIEFSLG